MQLNAAVSVGHVLALTASPARSRAPAACPVTSLTSTAAKATSTPPCFNTINCPYSCWPTTLVELIASSAEMFSRLVRRYYFQCVPAVLTEMSGPAVDDNGDSNGTAIAPFASCGIADSCQKAAAAATEPQIPASALPPPPGHPGPPPAPGTRPTPPQPAQALPPVHAALSSRGAPHIHSLLSTTEWCHQEPLPGADCATAGGEKFSCIGAPQSGPHTGAVDYRYTCIPTASEQPVA